MYFEYYNGEFNTSKMTFHNINVLPKKNKGR